MSIPGADPKAEILEILASHSGQPVDYVALFMFLNTVAGGHYEERYSEDQIRASLQTALDHGEIEAWIGEQRLTLPAAALFAEGAPQCHFRLRG